MVVVVIVVVPSGSGNSGGDGSIIIITQHFIQKSEPINLFQCSSWNFSPRLSSSFSSRVVSTLQDCTLVNLDKSLTSPCTFVMVFKKILKDVELVCCRLTFDFE